MLVFFLALVLVGMTLTQVGAEQATVRVVPASYTVPNVGLTFDVNITVESVENLYGYEFKLYYPNDILNGTSVTQGPFLKTGGVATFFSVFTFKDDYNATHGLVNVVCTRMGNVSGVNGNGTLATITFTSTSRNSPELLHLDGVKLSDPNPSAIPFTAVDGEVTVIPEFPVALILPLLIGLTLVAITLRERTKNHRAKFQSV